MNIDLIEVSKKGSIIVDENVHFEIESLITPDLVEIKDTKVVGTIRILDDELLDLDLVLKGVMILLDSVSLDEVEYPFEIKIDENIELNDEKYKFDSNTLDIFDILWENIVLEIPTRIVKDENEIKTKGEGWSLNEKSSSQLSSLKDLLDMEEKI